MTIKALIVISLLAGTALAQPPIAKLPSSPMAFVVDSQDNLIIHVYRGRILKLSPAGNLSVVTDDIRKDIKKSPYPSCNAMAIDTRDNVYMADGEKIWKMTPDGKVTLFAGVPFTTTVKDGPVATAQFRSIEFLEVDATGTIYVAERDNTNKDNLGDFYLIRKIDTNGMVTTLFNTRDNPAFKSRWLAGMGIDSQGNLYISDGDGRCIKKVASNGIISTVAGLCGKREFHPVYVQGTISKAELMAPEDILIDRTGAVIFADGRLNRIIKVANQTVATLAGNSEIQPNNVNMGGRSKEGYKDGKALAALFNFPQRCAVSIDSRQNIYILDGGNDCIRRLSADGMVTTIAKRTN
ncbi:hypothetical protein BN8_00315 [Fibrisoma limi BUZ 3]|uniref:NHL repeat containing protein n=1 Tax=Fibrisoma limi BUZ 3 TaxID=1185876 RepID=I2GBX1_9BACT|nr:hypothetical protein [Fibrisoma limi]CCH51395.1 hypothetical protein BN8_00315 [Fibrisoma limi BUZ 3]